MTVLEEHHSGLATRPISKRWPRTAAIAGLVCVLGGIVAGLVFSRPVPPIHHSKTNVLMLTLCTLRADHLGCYGYEKDVSPHIDALAKDGFRFERVLAQAPWTRSGVSAIITGMYPRSLNIEDPENPENYRKLHNDFTTTAEILHDYGYHTIGVTANPNTHSIFQFNQGFDFFKDPPVLWQHGYKKEGVWDSKKVNELFLDHLKTRKKSEKFFAHLVYIDVHVPRDHKKDLEPEDNFEVPPPGQRKMKDVYDLHVSFLDKNVGKLIEELKHMGYGDDLLILINADHGEGLRDYRGEDEGHSRHVYNSTIWVPWIIHHPALHPLRASYAPMVRQIDMLPTLLELLHIAPDKSVRGKSQLAGTSRTAALFDPAGSSPVDYGFVRTQFLGADKAAVVTSDYKLILNFDHDKTVRWRKPEEKPPEYELYRYREDRGEQTDLFTAEPDVAEDLKARYQAWEAMFPPLVDADELRVSKDQARQIRNRLKDIGYVGDENPDDAPEEPQD